LDLWAPTLVDHDMTRGESPGDERDVHPKESEGTEKRETSPLLRAFSVDAE